MEDRSSALRHGDEPRERGEASTWWRAPGSWSSSSLPVIALGAFTFVLLVAPQTTFPVLARLRIALLCAGAAILALVVDRVGRRQSVWAVPRGAWPALLLGLWSLATIPLSYWPGGSVELFRDLFVKSLIVLWLIASSVDTTRRLRRLTWLLCLLGGFLAVTGIRNYLTGSFLEGGAAGAQRIAGFDAPLTANPNDLAMMLNLLLPLTLALYRVERRRAARLVLLAIFALEAGCVIVTFSRAGFVTLCVVWTAYVLGTLRGTKRLYGALGIAVALGVVALLPGGSERLGTVTNVAADQTGSAQERIALMGAAVRVVLDHPLFGAGLGMNVIPITADMGGWRTVHNVYLQVAADLGLLGLGLFLALFLGAAWHARAVRRERERLAGGRDELHHLARGIELSLLAFGVAAMFHPAAYHFYVYYLGGMALAVRAIHDSEAQHG